MKPESRHILGIGAVLFGAALMQSAWAGAMRVHGAQPDFLVMACCLCALFCDANGGAGVGFAAGLLHACLASPPHGGFGSLIVSRTIVGFGVGWLEERIFRDSSLLALAVVSLGTILAELLFFLFAPQRHVLLWARSMGLATLYNTILALPFYFLVRRIVGAHRRREEF